VRSALRVADECGLPCVVSSALDTSVGIAMGAALAGALPELAGACGLGTVSLLGGDVVRHSLDGSGGSVAVRPAVPSTELLERWKATEDRQRWWSERVVRCIEVLGSQA
jgi:O-succinylbenzoate synthase